jgi:hypothetical protein
MVYNKVFIPIHREQKDCKLFSNKHAPQSATVTNKKSPVLLHARTKLHLTNIFSLLNEEAVPAAIPLISSPKLFVLCRLNLALGILSKS